MCKLWGAKWRAVRQNWVAPGVVHRFSGFLFDFRIKGQALQAQIRPCTALFLAKLCQINAKSLHCKGFLIQSQAQLSIRMPAHCHSLIFDDWPGSSSHPKSPQHSLNRSIISNQRLTLQGSIASILLHTG